MKPVLFVVICVISFSSCSYVNWSVSPQNNRSPISLRYNDPAVSWSPLPQNNTFPAGSQSYDPAFNRSAFPQNNTFPESERDEDPEDMYDIALNAAYIEDAIILNYQRLVPLSETVALGFTGGVLVIDTVMVLGETDLVVGGPRNFFEAGVGGVVKTGSQGPSDFIGSTSIISDLGKDAYVTLRAGYRYQAPKGFLFKLSLMGFGGNVYPLIGLGYTF